MTVQKAKKEMKKRESKQYYKSTLLNVLSELERKQKLNVDHFRDVMALWLHPQPADWGPSPRFESGSYEKERRGNISPLTKAQMEIHRFSKETAKAEN